MPTRFTELVGCESPLQLAAMGGGVGGPELAAAVRDAGGLGMVSAWEPVPDRCGVNFLVPFIQSPAEVADAARRSHVVEFFFGRPDPVLIAAAHDGGSTVGWQVGSGDEAVAAETAGCDYVIAQGREAGGHVRAGEPLDTVLAAVVGAVRVPVVAAGGIATRARVEEVLAAGAAAVRVGTLFLACPEARAHPAYVANLIAASGEETVLTGWFDGGWPDAPHRVLRSALEAARRSGWRSAQPPTRDETRTVGDMAQYAGEGVGAVTAIRPAADIVAELSRA